MGMNIVFRFTVELRVAAFRPYLPHVDRESWLCIRDLSLQRIQHPVAMLKTHPVYSSAFHEPMAEAEQLMIRM